MGDTNKSSVVFFGSGPVAAESLELLSKNFVIEAVVTKPQPAHHHEPFPVLVTAEKLGLKVFTPDGKQALSDLFASFSHTSTSKSNTTPATGNLAINRTTNPSISHLTIDGTSSPSTNHLTNNYTSQLESDTTDSGSVSSLSLKSQLGIVIDYGFIINQDVIDYFPLGIINSHFSLLPELRGADPISFAILSGQKRTGVSLMRIVEKMDEGPILAFEVDELTGLETTPSLTSRLILLSDELLRDNLPQYVRGEIQLRSQDTIVDVMKQQPKHFEIQESYSRKLTKKDGILDFTKPAIQLEREIRAFIEWPKSRTQLAGKDIVVTKATVVERSGISANVVIDGKNIVILCAEKALQIETLKPAGKNEMSAAAFLAGNKLD